jgi:glycosyltransferase involved in cell wall biosynthesis
MRISIITPSFNQGKFIEDAIQSVLNQNYQDVEHIVIDNCSTDNTMEVLKKYPHIKFISEPDQGQSDALNKGFRLATGEIIGWLNCDDFYLPGAFKIVADELINTEISGVYSDLKFCDIEKNITRRYISNRPSKILSLFHTYISSEAFFFRRTIIDNKIKVQNSLHYCMDQEFIASILHHDYKLKYVRSCFAVFRWQGENKSMHTPEVKTKRTKEGIEIFNKYNGYFKLNANRTISQNIYYQLQSLIRTYRYFLMITS